jgi:hypothetical protein
MICTPGHAKGATRPGSRRLKRPTESIVKSPLPSKPIELNVGAISIRQSIAASSQVAAIRPRFDPKLSSQIESLL